MVTGSSHLFISFHPVFIGTVFQSYLVLIPVGECVVKKPVKEQVQPAINNLECFWINAYFLTFFTHGICAPATILGLIHFRIFLKCFFILSRRKVIRDT